MESTTVCCANKSVRKKKICVARANSTITRKWRDRLQAKAERKKKITKQMEKRFMKWVFRRV